MATTLPPISYVISANPLPFYNSDRGTFKLPPLTGDENNCRRESIPLDLDAFQAAMRASHSRQSSVSSDTTTTQSASCSRTTESYSSPKSSSRSSLSPCPLTPPRIPLSTKPRESFFESQSRRNSIVSRPTPAFRLVPQPMLDPSRRPIRKTDALVVFPSNVGISQASQRKAKLLVGKDIETYFELQHRQVLGANGAPPRAYAYKMIWERRWSQSIETAFNKAMEPGSRRGSRVDMDTE